jgi:hypothetical protein
VILARKHPHLKSQLPLASFFSGLPDPSTRLTAYGPPLARLLAAARLRRKWGLLVDRMLVNAYVLGLLDAFGTAEAFGAFVGSVWERSVISLPIRLGHFGPAPLPRAGSLELFIESGRARSASIPATRPGGDWEWEKVADQLVDRVADSTLASYVLEKLEQGSGEAGHLQLREVARAR